jgi:hypothetical protein
MKISDLLGMLLMGNAFGLDKVKVQPALKTPLFTVSEEGDAERYANLMKVKEEVETLTEHKVSDSGKTYFFGNAVGGESKIPYVMSVSNCTGCGPAVPDEMRRVGDFFTETRDSIQLTLTDGTELKGSDFLPNDPLVVSALTKDGEYLSLFTFQTPGNNDHGVYKELMNEVMDKMMDMMKFGMAMTRLRSDVDCAPVTTETAGEEKIPETADAAQN